MTEQRSGQQWIIKVNGAEQTRSAVRDGFNADAVSVFKVGEQSRLRHSIQDLAHTSFGDTSAARGGILVADGPQADDAACARPIPSRLVQIALWFATVLVAAAFAFDYVAPLLLSA